MIIVEGFDGSGKTTLANAIAARTEFKRIHPGGPTRCLSDVMDCLARSTARMFQRVVQDRVTHISEAAYSMLRCPERSALALSRMSDLRMARLLIYCRPPDSVIIDNLSRHVDETYDSRGHMAFIRNHAKEMIKIYDTIIAIAVNHVNVVTYDYTVKGEDNCEDWVIGKAKEIQP